MPRKTFVAGEILTAADVNANLMDQAVMTFADAAARTAALPSPTEGMVTFLASTKSVDKRVASSWVPVSTAFTASATITATDSSWAVPSLGSPIVKVTVIGGGGGGGAGNSGVNGAAGGTTTFNAGGAGTVSAAGGFPGINGNDNTTGAAGAAGLASGNGGRGGVRDAGSADRRTGTEGGGGSINIAYLNLSGISTVNVTIGAGGAGAASSPAGGDGGRGEVIVEYVAA
jgi:hypothetical protein